jgi:hypothetical protein
MAETFKGNWRVRVTGTSAEFSQRFRIAGASTGKGLYSGVVGTEVTVKGDSWSIRLEWNNNGGSGWRESVVQRTQSFQSPLVLAVVLKADDGFQNERDNDFNDLVLLCEDLDPVFDVVGQPFAVDRTMLAMLPGGVFEARRGVHYMGVRIRNTWDLDWTEVLGVMIGIGPSGRAGLEAQQVRVLDAWSAQEEQALQQEVVDGFVRVPVLRRNEERTIYHKLDLSEAAAGRPEIAFVAQRSTPDAAFDQPTRQVRRQIQVSRRSANGLERTMTNRISGRVVLKESGAGIPDLIVEVHDVIVLTSASVLRGAVLSSDREAAMASAARRVGGVVTDTSGAFELTYDDEPAPEGSEIRRPALFLVVLAPEETRGDGFGSTVIHTSAAIRLHAGRLEQYLIHLTADQLTAAGLPVPSGTTAQELERPEAVIHDVGEALKRQIQLKEDVRLLAAGQVAQARVRSEQIETQLKTRLIEKLTNVPAQLAERFGLVPPDATRQQIEAATWKTMARNVEEVVNQQDPAVGFIQVPDADLPLFKTPDGEFRDDLTPEEVEPYLFGDATAGGRTVDWIREDPVALSRRGEGQGRTLQEALEEESDPGGGGSPGEEGPPDEPLTIEDLPIFLGRVVRDLTSPEAGLNGDATQRPTQDDIQEGTDAFKLRGGPADVPAVYDFHNLQIAFDHVWQQAIDEQVLSRMSMPNELSSKVPK